MNRMDDVRERIFALNDHVIIVAVTKTFPFSVVRRAYESGFRCFGENRVEEGMEKIEEAKLAGLRDLEWHMVGHVQSRKAGDVARLFDWVDSVDSVKLAGLLNAQATKFGKNVSIFFEVNLSGETTKYGFDLAGWERDPKKLAAFASSVRLCMKMPHLDVRGLMTMPPQTESGRDNRRIFQSMKRLSETLQKEIPSFGPGLNMGTSQDYETAIREGATHVRLGEALLGKREHLIR